MRRVTKSDARTSFLNQVTVRGAIASLMSLGLVDETNPPGIAISFYDSKKDIGAELSIVLDRHYFVHSTLKDLVDPKMNGRRFFKTKATVNEVLNMTAETILVEDPNPNDNEDHRTCMVSIYIAGLYDLIGGTYDGYGK